MHTLKRHGDWKSDNVAEGYVETSVQNKKKLQRNVQQVRSWWKNPALT
jgi:hypothetical protein